MYTPTDRADKQVKTNINVRKTSAIHLVNTRTIWFPETKNNLSGRPESYPAVLVA